MVEHFDDLETRSQDEREDDQFATLRENIARALEHAAGWKAALEGVDLDALRDAAALARLPLMRKSTLVERQAAFPPFAGLTAAEPGDAATVFASPGPIYELEGEPSDYERMARALFAAGFRRGDLLHNSFAYHLTPGGWMMHRGARELGCPVVPAGTGQTEQQVAAIAHLRPDGYTGTPDFLKVLLDRGMELGSDIRSIRKALVSGGALFPSLREDYADRGVRVLQCYATAECGLIAYETGGSAGPAHEGMVIDEGVIVEIVRPGTGDRVPDGDVGEVVVTTLNPLYPMLRLATGDLSAILPGQSPCGRTARRIKGWMGRADQTTKVKGMFVHPEQVADVVARFGGIAKARLVVTRAGDTDAMTLKCEVAAADRAEGLAEKIGQAVRELCKLRGAVELVNPGALDNDGKVIEDARNYET